MKTGSILVLAATAVCAVAGAFGARAIFDRAPERDLGDQLALLRSDVKALADRVKALGATQEELSARALSAPQSAPYRVPADEIDQAVARYLAAHAPGDAKAASKGEATVAEAPRVDLDAALASLLDPELSYEKHEELWGRLKAAGLLAQAIQKLEQKSGGDPKNADLHVALAGAYLQQLFTVTDGPEKGVWATKADAEYDRALEVDPNHWSARFSKAVSLSFWPPIFGKQEEAAKQFETLLSQQERSPRREPRQASTYLYLGNLYSQMGQSDKALDTWRKGLATFPDSAELKQKVDGAH